jgi:predicted DNA-binding protein (MmcQ/YjbR family)
MDNMTRLEHIVAELPEAQRVDVVEWDHPTFRVRGKNFIFCDARAEHLSVKLQREEAEAVLATDRTASPTGYGLGRHGWVDISVPPGSDSGHWEQVREWVRTSYTLIAPKKLARLVAEPAD